MSKWKGAVGQCWWDTKISSSIGEVRGVTSSPCPTDPQAQSHPSLRHSVPQELTHHLTQSPLPCGAQQGLINGRPQPELGVARERSQGTSSLLSPCFGILSLVVSAPLQDYSSPWEAPSLPKLK